MNGNRMRGVYVVEFAIIGLLLFTLLFIMMHFYIYQLLIEYNLKMCFLILPLDLRPLLFVLLLAVNLILLV